MGRTFKDRGDVVLRDAGSIPESSYRPVERQGWTGDTYWRGLGQDGVMRRGILRGEARHAGVKGRLGSADGPLVRGE